MQTKAQAPRPLYASDALCLDKHACVEPLAGKRASGNPNAALAQRTIRKIRRRAVSRMGRVPGSSDSLLREAPGTPPMGRVLLKASELPSMGKVLGTQPILDLIASLAVGDIVFLPHEGL